VDKEKQGRYGKQKKFQNAAKKANMRMNMINGEKMIIRATPIRVKMILPKIINI
jgi:hypothetical protein